MSTNEQAKRVLDNLYFNQRMFLNSGKTEYNQMMVKKISKDIFAMIDYMNGKITFDELPWDVRMGFCDIPEWFTKGT